MKWKILLALLILIASGTYAWRQEGMLTDLSDFVGGLFDSQEDEADNKASYSSIPKGRLTGKDTVVFNTDVRQTWVVIGRAIYKRESDTSKWEYISSFPTMMNDPYKLFYPFRYTALNRVTGSKCFITEKQDQYFSLGDDMLTAFRKKNITAISFERGGGGCYRQYLNEVSYILKDSNYVFSGYCENENLYHPAKIERIIPKIGAKVVNKFADLVCYQYGKKAVIGDLGFSEVDYQECKKDILAFQSGKESEFSYYRHIGIVNRLEDNLNYKKLIETVDSVKNINPVYFNQVLLSLRLSQNIGTSKEWVKITLTAPDGSKLEIENMASRQNAMYFPWAIYIDGACVESFSPDITAIIKQLYPSLLSDKDKMFILYELVKKLYSN